jgi:hypothetical protein
VANSQPGGLLVTWTDYWQTPTETGGLHFYGVPIHVFTEEEVLNALHLAKRNGFAMTGPITSPVTKNVICWGDAKDYPFVVFTLQKPS